MNQWSTSPVSLLSHDYCALLVLHFCCFDNRYLAATHLIPRARGAEGSRAAGLFLSVPPAPSSAKSHCCPSNRPTRAVALDCWISSFLTKSGLTASLPRGVEKQERLHELQVKDFPWEMQEPLSMLPPNPLKQLQQRRCKEIHRGKKQSVKAKANVETEQPSKQQSGALLQSQN